MRVLVQVRTWLRPAGADCFRRGTLVSVRYDPADPRRFVIEGWDFTGVDRLLTVVGTVLMAGTPAVLLVLLLAL
ncbi:DUF3592 domain-containing protein [Streptomyces sp. NPDC051098]|uniref:DUF3592 domain-containing protein n=1 Tax=Streptomyces sp. NPDC051098 TaxID=3155411 RepID=UPI00343FDE0E